MAEKDLEPRSQSSQDGGLVPAIDSDPDGGEKFVLNRDLARGLSEMKCKENDPDTNTDTEKVAKETNCSLPSGSFDFRSVCEHPPEELKQAEIAVIAATEPSWDTNKVLFNEFKNPTNNTDNQEFDIFDTSEESFDNNKKESTTKGNLSTAIGNIGSCLTSTGLPIINVSENVDKKPMGNTNSEKVTLETETVDMPFKGDNLEPIGWPGQFPTDPFEDGGSNDDCVAATESHEENLLSGCEPWFHEDALDRMGGTENSDVLSKEKRMAMYAAYNGGDNSSDNSSEISETELDDSEDDPADFDKSFEYKYQTDEGEDDDGIDINSSMASTDCDDVPTFAAVAFAAPEAGKTEDSSELIRPTETGMATMQLGVGGTNIATNSMDTGHLIHSLQSATPKSSSPSPESKSRDLKTKIIGTAIPLIAPPPAEKLKKWEESKSKPF